MILKVEDYRRMLGQFGVTGDMAVQQVESLSGGQKSRVAFAGEMVIGDGEVSNLFRLQCCVDIIPTS